MCTCMTSMKKYVVFHTLLYVYGTLSSQARSVFANPGLAAKSGHSESPALTCHCARIWMSHRYGSIEAHL